MNLRQSKFASLLMICAVFVCCFTVSTAILFFNMIFTYGVWHDPHGISQNPLWLEILPFVFFSLPFFIYAAGAFLLRKSFQSIFSSTLARILAFGAFALFPVLVLVAFIVYVISSSNF